MSGLSRFEIAQLLVVPPSDNMGWSGWEKSGNLTTYDDN
jgi:hypothetical protein